MAQWGQVDNAANSVVWTPAMVRQPVTDANKTALYNNVATGAFISGQNTGTFGVSAGEQAAARAAGKARGAHAGWQFRREGTGGRAGRVTYETLVAMKSISGDGSDDTYFEDYTIQILAQPESSNTNVNAAISFTVSAVSVPAGATLVYTWERAQGNGVFLPVASAGLFSGANSATLSVSNNATLNANTFRVIVQATGADNVVSQNATVRFSS